MLKIQKKNLYDLFDHLDIIWISRAREMKRYEHVCYKYWWYYNMFND